MFNALASIFWSLVKLVRTVVITLFVFWLVMIIAYFVMCYAVFQNAN